MRFPVRSFLAALAALGFAGTASAKQTVKIGAALSMTGPAAVYGANQKNGILAAVEEINKSGLLKDVEARGGHRGRRLGEGAGHQRLPEASSTRARSPRSSGRRCRTPPSPPNPIAQAAKVPVVAISNTAPKGITDIGDYIWRVSLTEGQVIPGALKTLQAKLGFKKAAVLYGNDDAFTKAGYDVMKAALADLKIQVTGEQTFAKPDRDYSAQLTQLLAQKPDILVVSALAENASGIVEQARRLGWQGPIFGGNGFNNPTLMKNAGPAAEGVLVGTAWNRASTDAANQKFLALMKTKNVDPDQFAAQAYVGVHVIAEAIKQAGMKGGRDDIKNGFAKVKDLPTPLGKFSFLPNRDGDHDARDPGRQGRQVPDPAVGSAGAGGGRGSQQVVNGLFLGSIYALFALGYTLVFGVLDILNLAHAAVFMLASFVALTLVSALHLHILVALPLAVLGAGLLGLVLERLAFRPLRGRADSNISGLISSLAMAAIFEAIALELWGPNVARFPFGTIPDQPIQLVGAVVSRLQLTIIAVAVVLFLVLWWLVQRTRLGRRGAGGGGEPARRARPRRRRGPGHRRRLLHLLRAGRRRGRALRPRLQLGVAGHGPGRRAEGARGHHPRRHGLDARGGAGRLRARAHRGLRGRPLRRLVPRRGLLRRRSSSSSSCARAACFGAPSLREA